MDFLALTLSPCCPAAADQGAAAPLGAAPLISPAVAPAVVQAVEVPSEAEAPASFDTRCAGFVGFRVLAARVWGLCRKGTTTSLGVCTRLRGPF